MKNKLEQRLFNRFPNLFPNGKNVNPMESLICFGLACSDGWYNIIWNLCEKIEKELNQKGNEKLKENFQVIQVKEKFGGLRYYCHGGSKLIWDMVFEAEKESFKICEWCGKPGRLDSRFNWYLTLCKECRNKRTEENKEKIRKWKEEHENE